MVSVSVIIPNYNHASYLQQRIDSVLNQTYTDFEVIILDDCSTDSSREVIEKYQGHEKVAAIVYNEVNTGNTFKQWDKGISLAKGEYIWIAESDDWCENNLLETLVQALQENKDCVLAYCQSYCVAEEGKIKFQSNHTHLAEYVNGKEFIKKYILPRNPIFNAGMAVWKKEIFSLMSKDFINYKLIGDYVFWIEICKFGYVFISGKLLNYFRTHEKSVSISGFKNGNSFIDHIPLYKKLLDQNLIGSNDYSSALKKSYTQFKLVEKTLPEKNAQLIKELFSKYSDSMTVLKMYFYAKRIKMRLKKLANI